MISALYRYPKHHRKAVAAEWGRRSADVHQKLRDARGADAETVRMRALHDAKGQIVREGATYYADRAIHWQVRRSLIGSIDQFDFVANGRVKLTVGPRKFPLRIRP